MKRILMLCTVFFFLPMIVLAGQWRMPVHLVYVPGLDDVVDLYAHNLKNEGATHVDAESGDMGIRLQPTRIFTNGLSLGMEVGPYLQVRDDSDFTAIPIAVFAGLPLTRIHAYEVRLRGGFSTIPAWGDDVRSSDIGVLGAISISRQEKQRWYLPDTLDLSANVSSVKFRKKQGGITASERINPLYMTFGLGWTF